MLIIIEGVDGAGKTTFAQELVRRLSDHRTTDLLHRGPIITHPLTEYELPLDGYRPMSGRHVICDRWHWGELIYGPLYRGGSKMQPADRRHIDLFLASRGAVIILMCASRSEIHRRLDRRGETFLQPEHRNDVIESYYRIRQSANTFGLVLPAVDAEDEGSIQMILGMAGQLELVSSAFNVHPTYVGPPIPYYLILGERRGPTPQGEQPYTKTPHSSAFVPYPATSGRFLLDHLPDDVYEHCGIANALEEDVYTLWNTLQQPRIVTLGKLAHEHLVKLDIRHGAAPHPQFIRRFHHAYGEEYGRVIREAVLHQLDLTGWRP